MKPKTKMILLLSMIILVLAMAGITGVTAQERTFTLPWSVIGAGGMGGSTDNYTLHSTLGQPVAGIEKVETITLTSGFWTQVLTTLEELFNYLPLIMK